MKRLRFSIPFLVFTLFLVFTPACAACEKPPAVEEQEEEKGQEVVPSETTGTTPEIIQEETPPIVEEEIIEEVNAPEIPGLKFDQETKNYLAEAGNPYGLEAGTEAGVYIKNAFEFEGESKDSIGLKAVIVEFIQKKLYKETKDYYFPIPFDLKETGVININELALDSGLDKGRKTLVCNPPVGTVFYAPFPGEWLLFWTKDRVLATSPIKMEGVDKFAGSNIYFKEGEMLLKSIKQDKSVNDKTGEETLVEIFEVKFGEPLGKITGENTLDTFNNRTNYWHFNKPGEYRFCFWPVGRDKSIDGINRLIKINETCFVSFFNKTAHEQNQ